ncbi:MAG: glycosyl hydrolase family 18 protein [Segetibacter sp.]
MHENQISFTNCFFITYWFSGFRAEKNKKSPSLFKVVGYYLLNVAVEDTVYADSSYLFLNKITHLNIAFINPDSTGNFKQDLAIDTLIKKAHEKRLKYLHQLQEEARIPIIAVLLQDDKRKKFVQNLVSLVQRYNLDGIDVDLEGSDIDSNYQNFVIELAAFLKPLHKLLTAAIATAYKDQLPDKALKQFDFVSVMSYDRTGPWRPGNPGAHSPYTMAVEDLDYWHNVRSVPNDKLVLGLPFYGYGFGALDSPVVSMNYKEIISLYPNNQSSDTLMLPRNVVMYYNSISTIKKKTRISYEKSRRGNDLAVTW